VIGVEVQRANNFNFGGWSLKALSCPTILVLTIIVVHANINEIT
jgi:hypothetical protein